MEVRPDYLLELFRGEARVASCDLPADARVRHTAIHPVTGNVLLQVESETFPINPPRQPIPECEIRLEAVRRG